MPEPEVNVYSNLEEASRAAAQRFELLARQNVATKGLFAAALSGGTTPRRLFELLAEPERAIPWDHTHLFQVDERCVPPTDPQSNYRMIRETLLSRAPIPEANFHRITAEMPARNEAARRYSEEMARILKSNRGEFPRLDLILLGMGPDGHTASLFPGSPALGERKLWVVENFSERLKSWRITLTLPVLNAAAQIIFLVAGDDKADTLRRVLEGSGGEAPLPARLVLPADGGVAWAVDAAAAKLLKSRSRQAS